MSSSASETAIWSRYWAGDRIAACMEDDTGNYGDRLGSDWRQWFAGLPEGSRVLDLGTGNGALVLLALAGNKRLHIDAIDYADIDPWPHLNDAGIDAAEVSFHGRTRIEELPFEDAVFAAVVSQYGIEYARTAPAVDQACRVLAPGGRIRWVCHHRDSTVYANSTREVEHARFMLHEARPSEHLERLIRRQIVNGRFIADSHRATAGTPERRAMDRSLQQCLLRLRQADPPSEFLDLALQNHGYVYQHRERYPPELVLEKVRELKLETEMFLGRMQALIDSALDTRHLDAIEARLATHGLRNIRHEWARKRNGDIIGVVITAEKPAEPNSG